MESTLQYRPESAYEIRARALKAAKVTGYLCERFDGPGPANIAAHAAGEGDWSRWAELAEVAPLSERCRSLVRLSLHGLANPPDDDPFEGL